MQSLIIITFIVLLLARQLLHWLLTRGVSPRATTWPHWTVVWLFSAYLTGLAAVFWQAGRSSFNSFSASLALALFAAALALRLWALRALGGDFSYGLRRPGRVVRRGPYQYLRHPLHLGLLAEAAALAWLSQNALGLAAFAAMLFGVWRRNQLEDAYLIAELGEEYRQYAVQVPALLPLRRKRRRRRLVPALDQEEE